MKTNTRAWQIYRVRLWAGLALGLLLALATFGSAFRFNRSCGWTVGQAQNAYELHEPSDLVAGR